MGVPKFYRWLSERYPAINQAITEDLKPEFDCLYLDMNGIVHNCTHSDDDTVKERITETQMFSKIFQYLDHLFNIIKPCKLLYMAIDGVAPRAKMNQQRQRRFRAAQDAAAQLEEARAKGETIPDGDPFDSNCITPGTAFMTKLSTHIQYYIAKKIKEDSSWQRINVIFSGAEVPGEGEHKIMAYIRQSKMQPGYNPNLRHCLYGLDADLIMLALVSHEPHFALLREEVVFSSNRGQGMNRKQLKKMDVFHFLHISVLREYLDMEFKTQQDLPFGYNLERIIDDWVFLCFMVGNDFLPHLPTMDIGESGLDKMFEIYREELPKLGGYITDAGKMDASRLEVIFRRIGEIEEEVFEQRVADEKEFNARRAKFALRDGREETAPTPTFAVADDDADFAARLKAMQEGEDVDDGPEEDEEKDDGFTTITRKRPKDTDMLIDTENATFKAKYFALKFPEFFRSPTTNKVTNPAPAIRTLVEAYLEGMYWVLQYYYFGVASWEWYFPYRYAPLASNMTSLKDVKLELQIGTPFTPLQQLLGVLPAASAALLPKAYQPLMLSPTSPVRDFYPLDFTVDMNGKRNPWEGIAVIPFISSARLLEALKAISDDLLTAEERKRNVRVADEWLFSYDASKLDIVKSTLPGAFPDIPDCHSSKVVYKMPPYPVPQPGKPFFTPTLCAGCMIPYPGYPHLKFLPLEHEIKKIRINVFGRESEKDTCVLKIKNLKRIISAEEYEKNPPAKDDTSVLVADQLAAKFVGRACYVDWPFLKEALCFSVCTAESRWVHGKGVQALSDADSLAVSKDMAAYQMKFLNTRGIDIGRVSMFVDLRVFKGMKRAPDGSIRKFFAKELVRVPFQLIVARNRFPDPRFIEKPAPTLAQAFPIEQQVIFIGAKYYGSMGKVTAHDETSSTVSVTLTVDPPQPDFAANVIQQSKLRYFPSHVIQKILNIHPLVLSRLTGQLFVNPGKVDIGLNLKDKNSMCVANYCRKTDAWKEPQPQFISALGISDVENGEGALGGGGGAWEYSELAINLFHKISKRFPDMFAYMSDNPNARIYDATSLVPDCSGVEAVETIQKFLKTLGISNMLLVPANSLVLPTHISRYLEDENSRYHTTCMPLKKAEVQLTNVPIQALYRPNPRHAWSPTTDAAHALGDRVLTLRSDNGVPLMFAGVVVGIHTYGAADNGENTFLEIVFDEEFIAGDRLSGKCSQRRGKTLPATSVLNLSKSRILVPRGVAETRNKITVVKTTLGDAMPRFVPNPIPLLPGSPAAENADSSTSISTSSTSIATTAKSKSSKPASTAPKKTIVGGKKTPSATALASTSTTLQPQGENRKEQKEGEPKAASQKQQPATKVKNAEKPLLPTPSSTTSATSTTAIPSFTPVVASLFAANSKEKGAKKTPTTAAAAVKGERVKAKEPAAEREKHSVSAAPASFAAPDQAHYQALQPTQVVNAEHQAALYLLSQQHQQQHRQLQEHCIKQYQHAHKHGMPPDQLHQMQSQHQQQMMLQQQKFHSELMTLRQRQFMEQAQATMQEQQAEQQKKKKQAEKKDSSKTAAAGADPMARLISRTKANRAAPVNLNAQSGGIPVPVHMQHVSGLEHVDGVAGGVPPVATTMFKW